MEFLKNGDKITPKNGNLTVRSHKSKAGNFLTFLDGAEKQIMVGVNKNGSPYLAYVDERTQPVSK